MGFSMEVSDPEVVKQEIVQQVTPQDEEREKLKKTANENADEILALDLDSLESKKNMLKSIEDFGLDTMRKSSEKNSLLQVSVGNLSKMDDQGGTVSRGLMDLQREIKALDPSLIDFSKTGILGKIFNPIRAYFAKYQKADAVISDIVVSLDKGKTTLKNDNTTLEIEQQSLRDLTKRLAKEIELGSLMDEAITAKLEQAKAQNADSEKIKFIEEEILFPLRQRVMDMQQMVVVNYQGIMAIEVVIRNNKELMRGVDRAKTVTISALRTATMVASALYNQKIVLKKIELLNQTTSDIISSTSAMLRQQGAEIQKQSMESGISVETLKNAFAEVIDAMESINAYKQQALPVMKQTIDQFKELAAEGEKQIERLEKGKQVVL